MDGSWMQLRRRDPALDGDLWRLRERNAGAFLERIVFDPQGRSVVGFKFKTDELFLPAWLDVREAVVRDRRVAVIHLRRRDLLSQYVSHQAVLKHGVPTSITSGSIQINPFRLDVEAALRYASDVRDRDERAVRMYRDHRSMLVEYESLDTDAICAFLNVRPMPVSSPTRKIISDRNSLIVNLDHAIEAFRTHGFQTE